MLDPSVDVSKRVKKDCEEALFQVRIYHKLLDILLVQLFHTEMVESGNQLQPLIY